MDEELRTPQEWQEIMGVVIMDPDGWRTKDAPAWDEPITQSEFQTRAAISTIYRMREEEV